MKVFINQDDCTGCGLCEETCPAMFLMWNGDNLAYVKEVSDRTGLDVGGFPKLRMDEGLARVPDNLLDTVVEVAMDCPGECVYLVEDE